MERGWEQRARLGRETWERRYGCVRLVRKTLTPHFTDFFTDFERKKNDCFAVYFFVFFFPTNPTCRGAWQYYSCNRLSVIARRQVTSITKVVYNNFLKAKSGTYDVAFLLTDLQETNISLVSFKDFYLNF